MYSLRSHLHTAPSIGSPKTNEIHGNGHARGGLAYKIYDENFIYLKQAQPSMAWDIMRASMSTNYSRPPPFATIRRFSPFVSKATFASHSNVGGFVPSTRIADTAIDVRSVVIRDTTHPIVGSRLMSRHHMAQLPHTHTKIIHTSHTPRDST